MILIYSREVFFLKWECEKCNTLKTYSETLDTYYCKTCDEWKESKCGDPECSLCYSLDKKPSEVVGVKKDYQLSLIFKDASGDLLKVWEEILIIAAKEYAMELKEIKHIPEIEDETKKEKVKRQIILLFHISLEDKEKMENTIFDIVHKTNNELYGFAFNSINK